jgi:hypothetical protein
MSDRRTGLGEPLLAAKTGLDVSIVNPLATAVSHSGAGACAESCLNPNAGTRAAEETKTNKHRLLRQQRGITGMDFVPIVFTASGGLGEQLEFQRRYWNRIPVWIPGIHTGLEWQRRMRR